jgi:AAA domain
MFERLTDFLRRIGPRISPPRDLVQVRSSEIREQPPVWQPIGFNDFLSIDLPPRKMLLSPILPERSLAMLYAPRGVGKTMLSLSIGVAVASGGELLRWSAAE